MSYVMEQEINSQAGILENLINKYVVNYCVLLEIPLNIKRVVIIASGSSYNAGVFGKYFFENISQTPCCVEYSSEFLNSNYKNYDKDAFYIFISQSGQSTDTLEAMKRVQEQGIKVASITNNLASAMYNLAQYKYYIDANEERAIAATKTFSATVVMLWILALKVAQNKHLDIASETKDVYSIKSNIETFMRNIDNIDLAAKYLSKQNGFAIFGFGINYALSLETALKIRETSYINTCAFPSGEFVHGHFAMLNNTKTFLTFITSDCTDGELKILNKVLKTYKCKSVIVSDVYEDYDCDILIKFQRGLSKIATIINMIILIQILALKIAIRLKRNVDKPQGLCKVVEDKG